MFPNGETTTASVNRICTSRSVGVSVDVNPFEPHILASNFAHAIGHNLGFAHDDRPPVSGTQPGVEILNEGKLGGGEPKILLSMNKNNY